MPSGGNDIADGAIAQIAALAPPPVATFVLTAEAEAISAHIRSTRPSVVQIVSPIDPAQSARLKAIEPHVRRVQVIHVESEDALGLIPVYAPHVHAFLLDSRRPGAEIPELGGTGRVHDWAISARFVEASPFPVFLAGGLTSSIVNRRRRDPPGAPLRGRSVLRRPHRRAARSVEARGFYARSSVCGCGNGLTWS